MIDPETRRERQRAHKKALYAADPEKYRARSAVWRKAHPEKHRAYMKNYTATHQEERRAYRQNYYAANREQILAKDAAYRETRKETRRLATRAWRAANCIKSRESVHKYQRQNPDVCRTIAQRKRARKRNAPMNNLTAAQWQEIKKHYAYKCVYCGRKMRRLTMDHITPLSKGGANTVSNIVPACAACNSRKYTGPPLCPVQPLLL